MQASLLQRLTAAWCLLMVALLTLVQLTVRTPPPALLFGVFVAVWLFGAAMLVFYPTFGAIGTGLYGVLLGWQVLAMHGADALNLAIALGSFTATGFSLTVLVARRRERKA